MLWDVRLYQSQLYKQFSDVTCLFLLRFLLDISFSGLNAFFLQPVFSRLQLICHRDR